VSKKKELLFKLPRLTITEPEAEVPPLPSVADRGLHVWRDQDGTVAAYGYTMGGLHWMYLPGLASFCFGEDADRVMAIPHGRAQEDLIRDAYHRNVLPMVLHTRDREVLHASAVLTPCGVVGLCAVSGTGKSTTAFALSQQGWPLWADDAVAFEISQAGPTAIPLPFGVRLLPEATAFFGRYRAAENRLPNRGAKDRGVSKPAPLAALLVLVRMQGENSGGEAASPRIRRLPANQAFLDVLAHAYCFDLQDTNRKRSMMCRYLDLVSRTPVFEVRFRAGVETLPVVLDGITQLLTNMERDVADGHESA
jgi:hypothetical protein